METPVPQPVENKIPSLEILDQEKRLGSVYLTRYISRLAMKGSGYIDRSQIGLESHKYQANNLLSEDDIARGVEWALSDRLQEEVKAESGEQPSPDQTEGHRASLLHELSEAFRNTHLKGNHAAFSRVLNSPYRSYERTGLFIERKAVELTENEAETIIASSDEDKLVTLAELLEPTRWRTDGQASEEEKLSAKKEFPQALRILSSLAAGLPKDLMSIAARELCLKRGDTNTADELLQSMDPRFARVLAWETGRDYNPAKIVEGLKQSSKTYGGEIVKILTKRIGREIDHSHSHNIAVNISDKTLATFLFDTHRLLTTHEIATGAGGGDSRRASEAMAGWIGATDVINPRPVYGTLVTEEEKLVGASSYGGIVLVMKPDVAARTTFTYGDSLNEHSYPSPEEQLVFEDAKRVKDAEITAKKAGVATGGINNPSRTLDYKDTRYVEAQILGGVEVDDVHEIIMDLPAPGFLTKFREAYPDIPLTVRVREQHAENLLAKHPDLFEQNAKRLGGQVRFIVIQDATDLGNDGRQIVNRVRTLASTGDWA